MTPDQVQEKLDKARKKQRKLRKEIDGYRGLLREAGYDPDKPEVDLVPRNKNIYKYWKKGHTFTQVAAYANLSVTQVSSICHRIERIIQERKVIPEQYEDLKHFKTEE